MCRLFGLHADKRMVTATFWLLDAPDNLVDQSRRNPDGTGLGVFGPAGAPVVDKQPMAAWQDAEFATEAHQLTGTTLIAHVRYSSSAALDLRNTHPFLQDNRIFAHNGVVTGLDVLDARLAELGVTDLVHGETAFTYNLLLGYEVTQSRNPVTADIRYLFTHTKGGDLNGWAFTLGSRF